MSQDKFFEYLKLVRETIQTNYQTKKDAETAMIHLLNVTDELAIELKGEPIVSRGTITVTERVTGCTNLFRIPKNL